MVRSTFPTDKFKSLETPFYYYDISLLKETLKVIKEEAKKRNYIVHYAIKANANKKILETIAAHGFGADCVSGNEVQAAALAGFPPSKIVFAGVGKTDKEIIIALEVGISCFNVESLPELLVIDEIARKKGKIANVALRINPNVDAETHKYITTGTDENKFGLNVSQISSIIDIVPSLKNINLVGAHYHIGSQIEKMEIFARLCEEIQHIQKIFDQHKIKLEHINVGGGLGVDYIKPSEHPIPDFGAYFKVFEDNLKIGNEKVHFELGRSIVAQCGSLVTRVTYVKEGISKKFAIVDAGMTDLIRPALYDAYHKIENLTSDQPNQKYDVVGPICESSDCFAEDYELGGTKRGDILVLRSAGAYGEIMASGYNLRPLPKAYYSDLL